MSRTEVQSMSGPDGPEERNEFYDSGYERDLDDADVREQFADEARDDLEVLAANHLDRWMRNDGIDSIRWPERITVRPVTVREIK